VNLCALSASFAHGSSFLAAILEQRLTFGKVHTYVNATTLLLLPPYQSTEEKSRTESRIWFQQ
jgi:hypothetical protein